MIIAFKGPVNDKPLLEISENSDQVVIRFIGRDEHITIHKQSDGTYLRTHYYPDKAPSVWDDQKISTAAACGYQKPERHGNYVMHSPLVKLENSKGYHLVGRLVDLESTKTKSKYKQKTDKTVLVDFDKFMLTMYLSSKENLRSFGEECVSCQFGEVCFKVSQPVSL